MKYLFYSIACICSFGTITYAIYLTRSAGPLWAIILVAWMFASMHDKPDNDSQKES